MVEILNVRDAGTGGYIVNGYIPTLATDEGIIKWLADNKEVMPVYTQVEIDSMKPKVVTMRQARLALLQSSLLTTVTNAIINGTDEAMKIEWEYATEMRRDWASLITLSTSLGITSAQLDDLFQLASTL